MATTSEFRICPTTGLKVHGAAESLIKAASNLKDFEHGLMLPGVKLNTSPTDFAPFDQLNLSQFNGITWVPPST